MGVLDSVLDYKRRKDAEREAIFSAPATALSNFVAQKQQAQQVQQKSLLDEMTLKLSGAKSGFDVDILGRKITPNPLLQEATMNNINIFNPLTGEIETKSVPKGPVRNALPLEDRQKIKAMESDVSMSLSEKKIGLPTADQRNQRQQMVSALESVDYLERLAKDVPSGYEGMLSSLKGTASRGETDTGTKQYEKEMKAAAVQIYRAKTGDTRLSDQDAAARAYPLLWNPSEGGKLKKSSFANLRQGIQERLDAYDKQYGVGGSGELAHPKADNLSSDTPPKFDPKTQRLQQNKKTGEYRVIPK